ncbi:MAG: Trm112 family protein [Planctomycetota bacterium]
MIEPELIDLMQCPLSKGKLTLAPAEMVAKINDLIDSGDARDHLDQSVTDPIEGGLLSEEASLVYPIREGIPTLIVDEAIRVKEA